VTVANWLSGENVCEDNHGHLATISDKTENDVVKKARVMANRDVWIGLHYQYDLSNPDRNKDLKWSLWVTLEPVTYTNWASSKPDFNPVGAWDITTFAYMDANGKWANQRAMAKAYVLEIP
jgi:hypothetical protein